MARSERPLRSCPLNLATTLRSSVVLKQVPTIEQYIGEANSQSLRRCLVGISPCTTVSISDSGARNNPDATASIAPVLGSGIGVCEGKVIIPRSQERLAP